MIFEGFPKIARLSRPVIITEKIDGTNAQVFIEHEGLVEPEQASQATAFIDGFVIFAGSRKRIITPANDNFGFAAWVAGNAPDLIHLGPGRHFGEWWGQGIQRKYGLDEKRFSLFNLHRWSEDRPACCHVVPILGTGSVFDTAAVDFALNLLSNGGSHAAPGFMDPEGVVVYHTHSNVLFKKTIKNDEVPKGAPETPKTH